MLYEKLSPTFQDLAKRYPHLYANISTLTLLNRLRLLLHLCRITEIYERLLFGTDYPPVRIPRCRLRPRNLRHVMQDNPDKKPLRRQVAVCHGLKIAFRSLGDLLPQPTAKAIP